MLHDLSETSQLLSRRAEGSSRIFANFATQLPKNQYHETDRSDLGAACGPAFGGGSRDVGAADGRAAASRTGTYVEKCDG